jgi:hypothetical protein
MAVRPPLETDKYDDPVPSAVLLVSYSQQRGDEFI